MDIPVFGPDQRQEKKAWWLANRDTIAKETEQRKASKIKTIPFSLPDKSYRLIYLHYNGKVVGCMVTHLINSNLPKFEFAIAAYNPKDKFDRNIGRQLALERILSTPYFVTSTKVAKTPAELKVIAYGAVSGFGIAKGVDNDIVVSFDPISPVRIKKRIKEAAKEWLYTQYHNLQVKKLDDLKLQITEVNKKINTISTEIA